MATAPLYQEFRYVLERERHLPEEEQSVFLLKPPTFREREFCTRRSLQGNTEGGVGMNLEPMAEARDWLNCGLMGWENYKMPDGSAAPFDAGEKNGRRCLSEKTLDLIAPEALELADAIAESGKLTSSEVKNYG